MYCVNYSCHYELYKLDKYKKNKYKIGPTLYKEIYLNEHIALINSDIKVSGFMYGRLFILIIVRLLICLYVTTTRCTERLCH